MSRSKKTAASGGASPTGAAPSAAAAAAGGPGEDDEGLDGEVGEKGVSSFITKIYRMVSDPATQDIVCWNERGDGFLVRNEFVFASQIMRTYFRHQNFSSFVRQLNFYGFHKRSSPTSLTSFYHPCFKKGHPELLCQIIRKSPETKDAGLRELVTTLQGEVAELRQQNEDLFKIQQRILFIFSRYMQASQSSQLNSGGAAGISGGASDGGGSATKRIRGGGQGGDSKRQRLLMEAKPDSPGRGEYHADNYSTGASPSAHRSNGDYFRRGGAAAAAASSAGLSPDSGVVDVNTDQYSSHSHPQPYGAHSLSGLDWSSDPAAAIQDLLTAMPSAAKSVLNSSTGMPMQMGRAAAAAGQPFIVDGYGAYGGQNNLQLLGGARGGGGRNPVAVTTRGGGGSGNQLVDLSAQLASSNPKQLLEMLDRMGADQPPLPASAGASSARNHISGVFEDVDSTLSAGHPSLKGRRGGGGAAAPAPMDSHAAGMRSRRSAASTAKLSPIEDDAPPLGLNVKVDTSPSLASLPMAPSQPVSPFPDSFAPAAHSSAAAAGMAAPGLPPLMPLGDTMPSGQPYGEPAGYPLLSSPGVALPSLSRENSGILGVSGGGGGGSMVGGTTASMSGSELAQPFYASPFHGPLGANNNTGLGALLPLTPTHVPLSSPPSPSPYPQH